MGAAAVTMDCGRRVFLLRLHRRHVAPRKAHDQHQRAPRCARDRERRGLLARHRYHPPITAAAPAITHTAITVHTSAQASRSLLLGG